MTQWTDILEENHAKTNFYFYFYGGSMKYLSVPVYFNEVLKFALLLRGTKMSLNVFLGTKMCPYFII